MLKLQVAAILLQLVVISRGFVAHPRIINGIESKNGDFPFFTRIEDDGSQCGGSLISDTWIVTAAHCLEGILRVELRANPSKVYNFTVYPWDYYIHSEYDDDYLLNDIALIRLPEPIKDKYVKPAKLPKSTSKALGDVAVVTAGTGYTQIEQTTSDHILRHAEFVTIPSSECEKDFNGPFIALSVVCTKTINGSAFYKGDSGGPLLQRHDNSLIGLVSFTNFRKLGQNQETYQVYTYIPYYYSWIKKVTGLDFS